MAKNETKTQTTKNETKVQAVKSETKAPTTKAETKPQTVKAETKPQPTRRKKDKSEVRQTGSMLFTLNLALSIITMVLAILLTSGIMSNDTNITASLLGASIITQLVTHIILFLVYKKAKDIIRIAVMCLLYTTATVFAFIAIKNYIFFYISNSIIAGAEALNQFLLIEKEKTKRGAITNILLGVTLAALCVGILLNISEENKYYICFVTVVLFLLDVLRKVLFPSLKFEKIRLLVDILVKTHAIDVFVGLIAFIIVFSYIFPLVEPNITTFWDAMWYCFAVVTTIGFGDLYAITPLGRILTVVLGIYGIVVVAIMTSVIVNFYNEVSTKEKNRNIVE